MARVSFAESSRANGTAASSPPAQHTRRKHSLSNQPSSAELASAQEANRQALAQEQRKKDEASAKAKATADRLAKAVVDAATQRGKKKNTGANKNGKKTVAKPSQPSLKQVRLRRGFSSIKS